MNLGSKQESAQENVERAGGYERYFELLETEFVGSGKRDVPLEDGWQRSAYEQFLDGEERLFERD